MKEIIMKKRILPTLSLMGYLLVGGNTIVGCNSETKPEPIVETYKITIGIIGEGGTLSFDKESAKEGDTITISVALGTNKKIGEITAKDSDGAVNIVTINEG